MRTVTRANLAEAAYQAIFGPSRAEVEDVVREVFGQISDALVSGESVKISRFGSFLPLRSKPRIGRNPKRPDEAHAIPAHRRVAFRAALELKHHVATGEPE